MRLFFSNRKLWNSYFLICIFVAIAMFLFIFVVYKLLFFVFIILIMSAALIYAAQNIIKLHNRVYIEIKNEDMAIFYPYNIKKVELLNFREVKGIRKSKHLLIITLEDNRKVAIKLTYINQADTKKLINYLKYHPAIADRKKFL